MSNNYNVYQYSREIEVVCLDDGSATPTTYLGNTPMFDGMHKLHKGIDNTLRFKIKDTDRKPIDLTNKTVIWKMYDRESRENVLFRYPVITNAQKGLCSLTIQTADTIMLPEGFYQFAMYTVENGVEQIIYTDTYDNAKGTIEVVDDLSVQPSTNDEDWFDMTPDLMYDSDIRINNETGVIGYVVRANVNWIRITYTKTAGEISKVLLRN